VSPPSLPHLALVTGAGKRLGRAIALRLADAGCDIAVHYNASAEAAHETVAAIRAKGRQADAFAFDQSDPDAIRRGVDAITAKLGRAPDVLVNCASIFEWDSIETVTPESLERHYRTNLVGPVLLTRAVAAAAADSTRGLILNITDHKLANTNPDHLAYTLSKYALDGFTHMMARALAPRFRVCAIAPGHTLPGPGETQAHFEAHHGQTPLARGPDPGDIAEAAAYLLGAAAITGQTLIVDGGSFMGQTPRDVAFR
jgi:NAD(P)-dependent dehydrogenase (short-subunit alcohol dehydrogenase family)